MPAPTHAEPIQGLLQIAGPNRPGMVAETGEFLASHGGSIVTCHAVRFGRQLFAANMLISAGAEQFARIEAGLSALSAFQPRLLRIGTIDSEAREAVLLYELTVYAYDKEGIVARVAGLMAANGLDVVQLSCVTYPAPFDGQPLFMIEMIVEAPNPAAAKQASTNVEKVAPGEGWDVYWKPLLKSDVRINPLAAYPPSRMGDQSGPPRHGVISPPAE